MICYRGSINYKFKRKKFLRNRSDRRQYYKRYARRLLRREGRITPKYLNLNFLINHP